MLSALTGSSSRLDTTIRPICFGIDKNVTTAAAASVGPAKFKRYEHVLYIMAQMSRIVYCDSGIAWKVMNQSLGMSNDVVNKVISANDWANVSKRRVSITSQPGDGKGLPMESYALTPVPTGPCFGTYISTKDDTTCMFIVVSAAATPRLLGGNSIFKEGDVIVTFKGSSTVDNFKHDLLSQFTAADLQGLIGSTGIKVQGTGNIVTGSFIKPLVAAWSVLKPALEKHIVADGTRLFLTGHSLGGAYTTLFAFLLAEGKASGTLPVMSKVASMHVISFGSPTVLSDTARNTFNRHLDSGLVTLDRVVSQRVAARSAATQLVVGGIAGPNDVIATIPAGFTHPGFKPLATNVRPEAGGRPYSIDNVRKFYGVDSKTRYRDPATWPFTEDIGLGDAAKKADLNAIVAGITHVEKIPEEVTKLPAELESATVTEDPQAGGGEQKGLYAKATQTHIPNFLSVQGSAYSLGFAHGEYLGMFFMGGFRLAGMKNPAKTSHAMFDLCSDGVKIQYMPAAVGGRRTRARRGRKVRKTMRRR
jgi:Lipase (class 3)